MGGEAHSWEKSQKKRGLHFKVQQQGACVIIVFNLHLLKSGIIIAFLTWDPELIFPEQNRKKNGLSQHALLCILLAYVWLQGSLQGQTEQSRLEDDCVPSFPVFFMTQPMYSKSYMTIETEQPINSERTHTHTHTSTNHWLRMNYQLTSLITRRWSGLHKKYGGKEAREHKPVSETNMGWR